jgi:hypothetical protein
MTTTNTSRLNFRKQVSSTADSLIPEATDAPLRARHPHHPAGLLLPDLAAPAVSPSEPAISYKLAFSDACSWYASLDGGRSKHSIASPSVAGAVIDLALVITTAERGGEDHRLRLAFLEPSGQLAELNLNAVNSSREGEAYVTSPVRSLTGALLTISESPEDMTAFCAGSRFSIQPGRGRGVFIEVDLVHQDQWLSMGGPLATTRISRDPAVFSGQIRLIKQRFRQIGLLLTGSAVIGTAARELTVIAEECTEA